MLKVKQVSYIGAVMMTFALGIASAKADVGGGVMAAFKALCTPDLTNTENLFKTARSQGWQPVTPDVDPQLKQVLAMSQSSKVKPKRLRPLGMKTKAGTFFAVLTGVEIQGRNFNGCYVYDFSATERVETQAMASWIGTPPTQSRNHGGVFGERWKLPKKFPGYVMIKNGYFAASSIATKQTGLTGVALAATAAAKQ
ncbi:MAG: hypothetical protein ACRBCJ_11705 [Hyphomicrobiaceae bacterium]